MQDFLTFKTFISPTVLIIMYFFGVFVMPFIAWWMSLKIKKYFPLEMESFKSNIFSKMRLKDKIIWISIVLLILFFMEICWRMMFEFLIAYMQIRDVLVGINL